MKSSIHDDHDDNVESGSGDRSTPMTVWAACCVLRSVVGHARCSAEALDDIFELAPPPDTPVTFTGASSPPPPPSLNHAHGTKDEGKEGNEHERHNNGRDSDTRRHLKERW